MALSGVKEYQPQVAGLIDNIAGSSKAANLYLFYGPSGSGRTTYARKLFQQLNDIGQFEKHQDFYQFRVDTRIKIEHIRDIQNYVKYGPREARFLVVLIEKAATMTTEAANAFLKTLEEPPAGVVFVLEVNKLSELLPTIVSRSQQVRFQPLKPEFIAEQLAARDLEAKALDRIRELQLDDLELIDWYLENSELFERLRDIQKIADLEVLLLSEELAKKGKAEIEMLIRALAHIFYIQQDYRRHNTLLKYAKKFNIPLNNKLFIEAMLYELKGI